MAALAHSSCTLLLKKIFKPGMWDFKIIVKGVQEQRQALLFLLTWGSWTTKWKDDLTEIPKGESLSYSREYAPKKTDTYLFHMSIELQNLHHGYEDSNPSVDSQKCSFHFQYNSHHT